MDLHDRTINGSERNANDSALNALEEPPLLAALFVIKFDVKVGYTIVWQRSLPQVSLNNVVEYKSLPSGLHNVKQDLVYFSYSSYTGISAYLQGEGSQEERSAKFVAVGALLPSHDGRMGRAWMHASKLMELAQHALADPYDMHKLEQYWEHNRLSETASGLSASAQLSPFSLAQRRSKNASRTSLAAQNNQSLPRNHPIWSTLAFVKLLGPLVFPLHRAALLRKRILFITKAPIRQTCEFVYILSVCSSVPTSLADSLFLSSESLVRLKPLFSVGLHDIPQLAETNRSTADDGVQRAQYGWTACSTDEILAVKTDLCDVLVECAGNGDGFGINKRPILRYASTQTQMKATQRDLRRWKMLEKILSHVDDVQPTKHMVSDNNISAEQQPLLSNESSVSLAMTPDKAQSDESEVLERTSWSELAYSSFLWWASAGEQDDFLVEENSHDRCTLEDLVGTVEQIKDERTHNTLNSPTNNRNLDDRQDARLEVAIISFFHGLTRTLFEVANEILDEGEVENDNDDVAVSHDEVAKFSRDDMRQLGLDAWSTNDKDFIKAFVGLWYSRSIEVDRGGVECCGIQVC